MRLAVKLLKNHDGKSVLDRWKSKTMFAYWVVSNQWYGYCITNNYKRISKSNTIPSGHFRMLDLGLNDLSPLLETIWNFHPWGPIYGSNGSAQTSRAQTLQAIMAINAAAYLKTKNVQDNSQANSISITSHVCSGYMFSFVMCFVSFGEKCSNRLPLRAARKKRKIKNYLLA